MPAAFDYMTSGKALPESRRDDRRTSRNGEIICRLRHVFNNR
jgi:hypothetical protein